MNFVIILLEILFLILLSSALKFSFSPVREDFLLQETPMIEAKDFHELLNRWRCRSQIARTSAIVGLVQKWRKRNPTPSFGLIYYRSQIGWIAKICLRKEKV